MPAELNAGENDVNSRRRLILVIYGVALVSIFVWVPWRGYEVRKDRGDPTNLGYGLVWSPPRGPDEVRSYGEYTIRIPGPDFAHRSATVDYGRVGLEFGALTGLLLVAWISTAVSRAK